VLEHYANGRVLGLTVAYYKSLLKRHRLVNTNCGAVSGKSALNPT
jgi:heme O synthase-like polyprenyltransferase